MAATDATTSKIQWPRGRYRLGQKAYMPPAPGQFEEVCEAGREIVYAGCPGPHMEPLDDAARKAVALRDDRRPATVQSVTDGEVVQHAAAAEYQRPLAATSRQADPAPGSVDIPADWKTRSWQFRKSLAAKLTSDPIRDADDAAAAIESEIERRIADDDPGPADNEI